MSNKIEVGNLKDQGVAYYINDESVPVENRLIYFSNDCEESVLSTGGDPAPTSPQEAIEAVRKLWGDNPAYVAPHSEHA